MSAPFDAVALAAGGGGMGDLRSFHLRSDGGVLRPLHVARWLAPPCPDEEDLLSQAAPPVLDVGCGPGRHTIALARRGVLAVGVDVSPAMVTLARGRGASVIRASIFEPLLAAGFWGSALLLDGNIGIGGDPIALLGRIRRLLRPGGRVLVEVAPRGEPTRREYVRLEGGRRTWSRFDWAIVGADAVEGVAAATRFRVASRSERSGRWFVRLDAV